MVAGRFFRLGADVDGKPDFESLCLEHGQEAGRHADAFFGQFLLTHGVLLADIQIDHDFFVFD